MAPLQTTNHLNIFIVLLRTERLQLRKLTIHDAPFILRIVNTITWHAYIGDRGVHNLEDARHSLQNGSLKCYQNHGYGLYMVELRDGNPIGICGILKNPELMHPEMRFAILPEFAAQGYMKEASKAVIAFCRNTLKMRRLCALAAPHNEKSIGLLKKLGFGNQKTITIGEEELVYVELNISAV